MEHHCILYHISQSCCAVHNEYHSQPFPGFFVSQPTTFFHEQTQESGLFFRFFTSMENTTIGPWATLRTRGRCLNVFSVILKLSYYLPLEKGMVLHLNKLESPLPKYALCNIGEFLHTSNIILLFSYNLPLEEGMILHLNKLEFPSHKDAMCQVKLKLAQWCEKRRYNFTVLLLSPLGKWHDPLFGQT